MMIHHQMQFNLDSRLSMSVIDLGFVTLHIHLKAFIPDD